MAMETVVTRPVARGKRYAEAETFRHFHDGPFGRCPRCGRMVFLPCLACLTERGGKIVDPAETAEEDPMRIQLEGDQRQRYEYLRMEKVAESLASEGREISFHKPAHGRKTRKNG